MSPKMLHVLVLCKKPHEPLYNKLFWIKQKLHFFLNNIKHRQINDKSIVDVCDRMIYGTNR